MIEPGDSIECRLVVSNDVKSIARNSRRYKNAKDVCPGTKRGEEKCMLKRCKEEGVGEG